MVFNRKDLAKAFSPNKLKVRTRRRLSGGQKHKPSTDGSTSSTAVQTVTETPNPQANVKVVVRVRPPSDRENQDNYRTVIKVVDDKMLIFDPKEAANPFFFQGVEQKRRDLLKKQNKELEFIFDKVFNITSINVDVFEESTKNIISSLLDGYNCSVFVYGATGAGKTHTMLGKEGDPGITYLTMTELFRQMDVFCDQREFNLGVSYLEIYNENVQDLLHKSSPLHIREDGKSGIIVAGLKIVSINDADELLALLAKGNKNRTQHPTDANEESSRSHAVFQIYVNITNKLDGQIRHVKLSMIDLAGSERASATGCKGARFKEGANINKSLLALGNCINNLADGLKHIPYRDSKLTRLLKDSLGGNCHTVMIANVSPSSLSYEDTYNTLRYANRAKKIKTNVKKNIISRQMHITSYIKLVEEQKKEIDMLKQKISVFENIPGQVTPSSKAAPITAKLEDDSSEWNKKLSDLYTKKKLISTQILSLESSDKILCCRIQNKHKASLRLQELSSGINTLNVDSPAETNTSCMKRIEKSMNCFERQRESNQLMMKSLWSDLQAIEEEIQKMIAEVEAKNPKNFNHTIDRCKIDLGDCMLTQQLEHAKKLCNLHESEMDSLSANVQLLSRTLQKFYNLMHGSGTLTDAIKTDFKQLMKSLEGVKSIKWSDSELTNDQQQLHDLSHLSVELLLNPIGNDLPPLPNIHLDREITNIPAKQPLDSTFVTDSPKTEVITSNNVEMSYDDNEDSSLKGDISDDEENTTNTNSINIERLNNTFTLIKAKAQKRALMDKNHVASKPSASKHARKVIVDSKKTSVLQNNNNNNAGKENKSVKSVMSVKSIEILNKIKNDRKTSAPNLMVPFAVQSNSISLKPNTDSSKVVAGKLKRGLTTNSHPNNRANEKQKVAAVAPSSRVPW